MVDSGNPVRIWNRFIPAVRATKEIVPLAYAGKGSLVGRKAAQVRTQVFADDRSSGGLERMSIFVGI